MTRAFALVAVVAAMAGCKPEADALVLLDVRGSGMFSPPAATLQLSAPGWPTRSVAGTLGPEGVRVGYYGPGGSAAVTITVAALDARSCVVGGGSATALTVASGATTAPITLFVRPLAPNSCGSDAGSDASLDAAVDADASRDANTDASPDGDGDGDGG